MCLRLFLTCDLGIHHDLMQDGMQQENIAPTGAYDLAYSRSPTEVLAIVFLGDANVPGGFFPTGVNGGIQS